MACIRPVAAVVNHGSFLADSTRQCWCPTAREIVGRAQRRGEVLGGPNRTMECSPHPSSCTDLLGAPDSTQQASGGADRMVQEKFGVLDIRWAHDPATFGEKKRTCDSSSQVLSF